MMANNSVDFLTNFRYKLIGIVWWLNSLDMGDKRAPIFKIALKIYDKNMTFRFFMNPP